MKILLLSSALLFTSISFAQLFVQPNTTSGTDSYVYVKDQILFVEQDVSLVANTNDPTTVASIYLREGAQLIQGATSSLNGAGNGLLSVYQNAPNDDAWDYTYWCSPVGSPLNPVTGNQNFGILRVHDSLGVTNSAVTLTTSAHNGIVNPLTISTRWLYRYPAGGPFISIYAGNNVPVGYGFTMKGVGVVNHDQTYDFRGRPNNGDIPVAVTINNSTLSGNPYPSALDLNAMFHDAANTEINNFLYWDEDRTVPSHFYIDNKGGYGTWVPDTGSYDPTGTIPGTYTAATFFNYDNGGNPIGSTGTNGSNYERRFAPIGQGFMINADAAGDNTVVIKNSHRRYIKEGTLSDFRSPENQNRTPITTSSGGGGEDYRTPHLRIYTDFQGSHFRDMVLNFSDHATDGYDRGFDALHPNDGAQADAYFLIGPENNRKKYVIQGVKFELEKRIPIAFTLNAQRKFAVAAVEEVKMNNTRAYLYDQELNTYKQITGGEKAEQILPAGTYDDRFFIVFRSEIPTTSHGNGLREQILASVSFFQNNPASQLEISNPDGYEIKSASIYDMSGKLVLSENNVGNQSHFTFYTGNLSNGVYLVKLLTKDDIQIDYKTIVNNRG